MTIPDPMIAGTEEVWDEWTADNGLCSPYTALPIATIGGRMLSCWFDSLEPVFRFLYKCLDDSFSTFFFFFIMHSSWICTFTSVQSQFNEIVQNQSLLSVLVGRLIKTVIDFDREDGRFLSPKGILDLKKNHEGFYTLWQSSFLWTIYFYAHHEDGQQ